MKIWKLLCVILTSFLWFEFVECFFPLIPVALTGIGGAALYGSYYVVKCRFKECCDNDYIPANFSMLDDMLRTQLYGQQIAHDTVIHALKSHFGPFQPRKALAMSFHGRPGSGKNYVASFIAKALFKEGEKSKYFHMFKGRIDFPSHDNVDKYKEELTSRVINSLSECHRSFFVFDEVDKMPEGVLNALVPFMDYHIHSEAMRGTDPRNATFIFLSNTGGSMIVQHLIELWEAGKKREQTKLQDFESLIAIGAFNEKGGFHRSDTIEASLIDHYVPFLPLEESHVRGCLKDAFRRRGVVGPTPEMMAEALSHVTFGPAPHDLYSNAGCKRIEQKVATIVYQNQHNHNV